MIGHEVFILSYNCSMSIFMLHILLEGFSARPAFFPNYFYIEKSGSSYGLIMEKERIYRFCYFEKTLRKESFYAIFSSQLQTVFIGKGE